MDNLSDTELKNRLIFYLKDSKDTQRHIAKATKINEGILSRWKNKKPFGFITMIDNGYEKLDLLSKESLNDFLNLKGY